MNRTTINTTKFSRHSRSARFLFSQLAVVLAVALPLVACAKSDTSPDNPSGKIYKTASSIVNRDSTSRELAGSRQNAITRAASKVSPAVVGINVTETHEERYYDPFMDDPFFRQFFGDRGGNQRRTYKYQVEGLGSGFLISADGYILTNDHVAGNASKIIVTTTSGKQYDAQLIATDPTTDVALLKIKGSNLPYVTLGNSDDLTVGEWAIAMGNPFGLFSINDKPTVTVGVISNTEVNLGLQDQGHNYRGMIQTDAAISSGNSGGPLLNSNGEVIGINAVIRSTAQSASGLAGSIGLGFAIPINKVKKIVDEFMSGRKIDRPSSNLGFRVSSLTDELRQYFHIETDDDGVVVTDMMRNSPAGSAGLEPGDLITKIDGSRVRSAEELLSIIADHRAGDTITITVNRGDKTENIKLKLPAAQTNVTRR